MSTTEYGGRLFERTLEKAAALLKRSVLLSRAWADIILWQILSMNRKSRPQIKNREEKPFAIMFRSVDE